MDKLHLRIRTTDVLTENLIATAIKKGKRTMKTKWSLKNGPMIKSIASTVLSCSIPFNIWKKNNIKAATFAYASLVGNKNALEVKVVMMKCYTKVTIL